MTSKVNLSISQTIRRLKPARYSFDALNDLMFNLEAI